MINILLSRGILDQDLVYETAKTYIKKEMSVCILAFSFFAETMTMETYHTFYRAGGEYYEKMINMFSRYGITEKQIKWVYYDEVVTNKAKELIKTADILYFPGGAPDQMMNRIIEKSLYDVISSFDKIVIGSSAGAMIQQDFFHISPDAEYPNFSVHKGLQYIKDLGIEVHFRRRKIQKKAIRKISAIMRRPLYVIPDDGALILTDDKIITLGTARLYYRNQKRVKSCHLFDI